MALPCFLHHGCARYLTKMVAVLIFGIFCPLALGGEHDPHPVRFESRRSAVKKPVTESNGLLRCCGAPNGMSACGWRRPLPLRRFAPCVLRWKTLRVSSAPHPAGFESRRSGAKKPATELATSFSIQVVPPTGFEPVISTLKGWRPWPLDDGDSGKEYSRLFRQFVYR